MKDIVIFGVSNGRSVWSTQSLSKLGTEFGALAPQFELQYAHSSEDRPAHAANLLIDTFLNTPRATWFVWLKYGLDFGLSISGQQLFALFNTGNPIAGALVADRPNWDAKFYDDLKPDENGVLPVPELGAAVKIFHRSVFEAIEKTQNPPAYLHDNSGRTVTAFCQEAIYPFGDYNRLLCPDAHLDMLCRRSNIPIVTNVNVRLRWEGFEDEPEPYRPWEHTRKLPPVCAEDLPEVPHDPRDIVVAVQYCDKDKEAGERLANHILRLGHERTALVYSYKKGYPAGPNDTALKLLRFPPVDCKAVLLIEPDCCPLTPDWLDQLSRDWDRCAAAGKLIMGSWHPVNIDHPEIGHINGNLMFSPDLAKRITIPDVPDDKPWDTYVADVFEPVWARTGLIKNLNRHRTATLKQLTTPECGTRPPVLIHGVRDESAWNYAKNRNT